MLVRPALDQDARCEVISGTAGWCGQPGRTGMSDPHECCSRPNSQRPDGTPVTCWSLTLSLSWAFATCGRRTHVLEETVSLGSGRTDFEREHGIGSGAR